MTLQERFSFNTMYVGDCIVWTGALKSEGYGSLWHEGKNRLAHRVAYELQHGPIENSLHVDHICRNRPCVNGAHLRAVSHRDNLLAEGSLSASNINRLKTHCVNGHELFAENLCLVPRKNKVSRGCRTCKREAMRKFYAARPR